MKNTQAVQVEPAISNEKKARIALRSVYRLTTEKNDPELYFNRVEITWQSAGDENDARQFGREFETQLPSLLDRYVQIGFVQVAKIKEYTGTKIRAGYRADLSKRTIILEEISRK